MYFEKVRYSFFETVISRPKDTSLVFVQIRIQCSDPTIGLLYTDTSIDHLSDRKIGKLVLKSFIII
jgi:hypothetical protein